MNRKESFVVAFIIRMANRNMETLSGITEVE